MSFSTFPNNPFPPSTAQFDEGKNDAIQAEIDSLKNDLIGQQFLFAENVQRVEVLEYNSINIGKISAFTLKVKSLISDSNTPSIGDFSILPKKDTAINCIDITDGVSVSLGNSVSSAVSTIGRVFIKEMITNHIYLISGTFVTN